MIRLKTLVHEKQLLFADALMTRSGNCPSPSIDRQRNNRIECFTDAGCYATQRCCHTFSGSYCFTALVVIG